MSSKSLWSLAIATMIGMVPLSVGIAIDSSDITQYTRVVVVSKQANHKETNASLTKYKHKKIKSLTNLKGTEVILVDDTVLAKIRNDNTIQVFEDVSINGSMPKKSKLEKRQQIPWGVQRVGADKAWTASTGKGIKVAVLDSGIDRHKNLRGEFNAIEPANRHTMTTVMERM